MDNLTVFLLSVSVSWFWMFAGIIRLFQHLDAKEAHND
jgi:hypothetical protein